MIRGWTKPGVADEDIVKLLIFSGLDGVVHILRTKGYSARRSVFDDFLNWIRGSSCDDNTVISGDSQDDQREAFTLSQHRSICQQLPRIDCTFYPTLSRATISRVSKHVPSLQSLFVAPAERIILEKDTRFSETRELPSLMELICWAFSHKDDELAYLDAGGGNDDIAGYVLAFSNQAVGLNGGNN